MNGIKKLDNFNDMIRSPWKLTTMPHQRLWLLGVLLESTMSIVEETDGVNWMTIGAENQPWCLFNDYECYKHNEYYMKEVDNINGTKVGP